jgi:hypothetical protein
MKRRKDELDGAGPGDRQPLVAQVRHDEDRAFAEVEWKERTFLPGLRKLGLNAGSE